MSNIKRLFDQAVIAKSHAYAPYSKFAVGAALVDNRNKIFACCNVENVSYPCGTCAEAGAIAMMAADGGTQIEQILIVADGENLIVPCGACLQRIHEFSTERTIVHLANSQGVQKSYTITQLMPVSFDEESLRHD